MKLLFKYLFLLLPMIGRGQHQVIINKLHEIKSGLNYNREDNCTSAKSYNPCNYIQPYTLLDSSISFYKEKRVSKIEVLDTLGKVHFVLFLNIDGTLASSYCIDRGFAFKEVFEPSLYSRSSIILNTTPIINDSFVSKIFTYKNADTTIIVYHNTTYTFKMGDKINSRNSFYNDIFMHKNNPNLQKNPTPYSLDYKMTRLLAVNYDGQKLYKCSEKRFCSWTVVTKNNIDYSDGIERQTYLTHPFIQKLNFEKCINWFVDGENFDKPTNSEFEIQKNWSQGIHCGNGSEYIALARDRAEFTFESYSQNEYGLNDTAFLNYYPMASRAELTDCHFFVGQDPSKSSEESPSRVTEKMRSQIPDSTPHFIIRYEYYKD